MKIIKDLKELEKLAYNKSLDCFISLAGGLAKSSKIIYYHSNIKKFEIFNEIDGVNQLLKKSELSAETNIVEALDKGCLIKY